MNDPLRAHPKDIPRTVTIGNRAFRRKCEIKILLFFRPFALAVFTKS